MEKLTESILDNLGVFKDSQYCIWSPDLSFRLYIKRIDSCKFAVKMHRNNTHIFLRYVSFFEELQCLYESITDVKLIKNL